MNALSQFNGQSVRTNNPVVVDEHHEHGRSRLLIIKTLLSLIIINMFPVAFVFLGAGFADVFLTVDVLSKVG